MDWIKDNITVIASLISAILGFLGGMRYEKKSNNQKFSQSAGDNSELNQSGRDQKIVK